MIGAIAFSALLAVAPTEPWAPPEGAVREALLAKHVRPEGEGFFRASGGAYVIRTDVSAAFALDAACFLERFRSQLRHIFRDPPVERYPPLVVIYRDEARYRRAIGGGGARGMFIAPQRTLFTYLAADKGERDFATFYSKILLHEGAHQLLHALCGPLPPWFDEGVASYFQEWDVRRPVAENLERLKTTHFRFGDVKDAFGTERWVPLRTLLALEPAQWAPDDYGPRTLLHYAEAASFISYLLSSKPGQKTFARVYEAARDPHQAIEDVLTPDAVCRLDAGWKEYVAALVRGGVSAETTPTDGK